MKRANLLFASLLSLISLGACTTKPSQASLLDYVSEVEIEGDEAKILQLADLHWNLSTDLAKAKRYIDKLVEASSPDLIVLTGDQTMDASKDSVISLLEHLETYEIPYAMSYGNHDFQGSYTIRWLNETIASYPHSLFKNVEDEVTGYSNYVVNLTRNGEVFHQVYVIDSGNYVTSNPIIYSYGYIDETQVDWYKAQAELAKRDEYIPSSFYFHIPFEEYLFANTDTSGKTTKKGGYLHEKICEVTKESMLFEEAKTRGAQGYYVGHEHSNAGAFIYDDVLLAYGVKTTNSLYYSRVELGESKNYPNESFDLTGAALITISNDGTYTGEDLEYLYLEDDCSTLRRENPLV